MASITRDGVLMRVSEGRTWDGRMSVGGLSQDVVGGDRAESSIVLQASYHPRLVRSCDCWGHRVEEDLDGDGKWFNTKVQHGNYRGQSENEDE